MVLRRVVIGSATALAALAVGSAAVVAAPPIPSGCSFSQGTTTCVASESAVTTHDAPDGVDGTRVSAGPTVGGDACLSFEPTAWYYGAYMGSAIEITVRTTTTTTYRGRAAHRDKKISSTTVESPASYRVTEGGIYCYVTRSPAPFVFSAPYPS